MRLGSLGVFDAVLVCRLQSGEHTNIGETIFERQNSCQIVRCSVPLQSYQLCASSIRHLEGACVWSSKRDGLVDDGVVVMLYEQERKGVVVEKGNKKHKEIVGFSGG
jgi:hypothetical protein